MSIHDEELGSAFFAAPLCVRISVPELAFGSDMDAMIESYWERGEELCTGYLRTRTYPRDWIYFCFTDAKNAEDFAGRFGGESLSPAEVSRFLPYCVRISVPELGFGSDMDAMIEFYWECGEELCTGYLRTRTYPRDWIYFCFTDAKNAEDFAGRFGGESLSPAEVSLFLPLNSQWPSKN